LQAVNAGENTMLVMERIQAEVETHPVVLFMKGTPQFPMCGFSSRAAQALKAAGGGLAGAEPAGVEHIHTINVLQEPEIRANLPRFSNWPTFPQLFIHGELIGGCDITLELLESGELQRIVSEALAP
jgi:monothiol glutaredoxin